VEGQDVDLTVILTLHSYVTCQSGVCVCVCVCAHVCVHACVCAPHTHTTKVSVLNPYIIGLKRKVNNYMEQMSLLLCIWFN
jgi:hypothetical protein